MSSFDETPAEAALGTITAHLRICASDAESSAAMCRSFDNQRRAERFDVITARYRQLLQAIAAGLFDQLDRDAAAEHTFAVESGNASADDYDEMPDQYYNPTAASPLSSTPLAVAFGAAPAVLNCPQCGGPGPDHADCLAVRRAAEDIQRPCTRCGDLNHASRDCEVEL